MTQTGPLPQASASPNGTSAPTMQTEIAPMPVWLGETGNSGLKAYGGFVRDEWLPQLASGRQAYRVYREMSDNCATVSALLFAIKHLIRALECRVEVAGDDPESAKAAEFVESCMDDMSGTWDGFLTDVLTMLEFGYAPVEMVFKRRAGHSDDLNATSCHDDGLIGIGKMSLRSQETLIKWLMDDKGTVYGMTQQPWNSAMVNIPIQKLLLFRTTEQRGNPEGESLLRKSYRAWYFLKRLEEFEGMAVERNLVGIPQFLLPTTEMQASLGTGPDAVKAKQMIAAYQKIGRDLKAGSQSYIITPSDRDEKGNLQYEFKLVTANSGGKTNLDLSPQIERYKNDILSTVLADFISLGHGARGTQALATTKTELFMTAVQGFVKIIEATLNRTLLPTLWRLNGFDPATMPTFAFDSVQKPDIGVMGAFLQQAAAAGMPLFPDAATEAVIRDMAGLPPPPEDGIGPMPGLGAPGETGFDVPGAA